MEILYPVLTLGSFYAYRIYIGKPPWSVISGRVLTVDAVNGKNPALPGVIVSYARNDPNLLTHKPSLVSVSGRQSWCVAIITGRFPFASTNILEQCLASVRIVFRMHYRLTLINSMLWTASAAKM